MGIRITPMESHKNGNKTKTSECDWGGKGIDCMKMEGNENVK